MSHLRLCRLLAGAVWRTWFPFSALVAAVLIAVGIARQWSPNLGRDDALISFGMLIAGSGVAVAALVVYRWPRSFGHLDIVAALPGARARCRRALLGVIAGHAICYWLVAWATVWLWRRTGAVERPDPWELVSGAASVMVIGAVLLVLASAFKDDRALVIAIASVAALEAMAFLFGLDRPYRWLVPWVPITLRGDQPTPELTYRPMEPHALYLLGLATALTVVIALDKRLLRATVTLCVVAGTIALGYEQTTSTIPVSEATARIEHARRTAERSAQQCPGTTIKVCVLPGYERWVPFYTGIANDALVEAHKFGMDGAALFVQQPIPALGPDDKNPNWYIKRVLDAIGQPPESAVIVNTDIGTTGVSTEYEDYLRRSVIFALFGLPLRVNRRFDAVSGTTRFGPCDASRLPQSADALTALANNSPRFRRTVATVATEADARIASVSLGGTTFDAATFRAARHNLGLPEPAPTQPKPAPTNAIVTLPCPSS